MLENPINAMFNFKREITYENRYLSSHAFWDIIEAYEKENTFFLNQGESLYRARILTPELNEFKHFIELGTLNHLEFKDRFDGFDAKGSMPLENPDLVPPGRANPRYIGVLYAADSWETALAEVRPTLESKVSVALLRIKSTLKIMNFSEGNFVTPQNDLDRLNLALNMLFSTPSSESAKDYIPSQYIAEKVKSLGFDGIGYLSSQNPKGQNYAIFNADSCEAISSQVFHVHGISYDVCHALPYESYCDKLGNQTTPSYKTDSQTPPPGAAAPAPTESVAP